MTTGRINQVAPATGRRGRARAPPACLPRHPLFGRGGRRKRRARGVRAIPSSGRAAREALSPHVTRAQRPGWGRDTQPAPESRTGEAGRRAASDARNTPRAPPGPGEGRERSSRDDAAWRRGDGGIPCDQRARRGDGAAARRGARNRGRRLPCSEARQRGVGARRGACHHRTVKGRPSGRALRRHRGAGRGANARRAPPCTRRRVHFFQRPGHPGPLKEAKFPDPARGGVHTPLNIGTGRFESEVSWGGWGCPGRVVSVRRACAGVCSAVCGWVVAACGLPRGAMAMCAASVPNDSVISRSVMLLGWPVVSWVLVEWCRYAAPRCSASSACAAPSGDVPRACPTALRAAPRRPPPCPNVHIHGFAVPKYTPGGFAS